MKLNATTLDRKALAPWPSTCAGLLLYGARVIEDDPAPRAFYAEHHESALVAALREKELADMPNLAEARRAFKAFGADPGRRRVSSEALWRRIRQGRDVFGINSVVDCNNVLSVASGLSFGSYDADRIRGDVVLGVGAENEVYPGMGNKDAVKVDHLPVLRDDEGSFGSPVSDSLRTRVTEETTRVLTVIYCFSGPEVLERWISEARTLFATLCRARDMETLILA